MLVCVLKRVMKFLRENEGKFIGISVIKHFVLQQAIYVDEGLMNEVRNKLNKFPTIHKSNN